MKKNFLKAFKIVSFLLLFGVFIVLNSKAQVNSINIGSIQQNVNPGNTFNPWIVTQISTTMRDAPCYENTQGPQAPTPGFPLNTAVLVGQAARLVPGFGSVLPNPACLSPFSFNTIYTPLVTQPNNTNCTVTFRRSFIVCSSQNEDINFNFNINCDDGISSIILDAGTLSQSQLNPLNGPFPAINNYNLNVNRLLASGLHTVDIQCYDLQVPINGQSSYFMVNGVNMQWNPFAFRINGTISSPTQNNVLFNGNPTLTAISGPTTVCAGSTINLTNTTAGGVWSSSNTAIATIDQAGIVTGNLPGNTTITYSIGQGTCARAATYNISVTDCHCEDPCSWSVTGNTLVRNYNFIGSINNADFKIRTNNIEKMIVTAGGNVGIGTSLPTKLLDINGETAIRVLPSSSINDKLVFANSVGELKSLLPGNTNQYLSGNGSWQNLPIVGGGGTVTNADQGVTLENATVLLGDYCGNGGGRFQRSREINLNNNNLYFNSSELGKLYIGNTSRKPDVCKELNSRLEISSYGLDAFNDYSSPNPSTSGLRFTNLTSQNSPIVNESNGVLSLDKDGDVIWVNACCNQLAKDDKMLDVLNRLDKLENELKNIKEENNQLKNKLIQSNLSLEFKGNILEQNIPNPFSETTTIGYSVLPNFIKAEIIFNTVNGIVIKTIPIKDSGKGQIKISSELLAKGLYSYSLIIDGKIIETKKMIKL